MASRFAPLLIAAGAIAVASCDREPHSLPTVDVPAQPTPITVSTTATRQEVVPDAPVTVASLVADGQYWRLATKRGPVHVWIPNGYRARRAETVIYVHGFYTYVDRAWREHDLAAQFAASAINAMFIAPEAPANGTEPVSWPSLEELLQTVERGIGQRVPHRRLVALGHSGAWRTLVGWLDEPLLDTVVLLDAVYGAVDKWRAWVLASPKRRLITIGDTSTRKWTEQMHAQLPDALVLDGFPAADRKVPRRLKRAQIVYIRSRIGHFPLVTGGIALPMTLRLLRGKLLLDTPLTDLLDAD